MKQIAHMIGMVNHPTRILCGNDHIKMREVKLRKCSIATDQAPEIIFLTRQFDKFGLVRSELIYRIQKPPTKVFRPSNRERNRTRRNNSDFHVLELSSRIPAEVSLRHFTSA
jgi:hypothetical protein